eukprot:920808-Ditylum_brightwellii.AAC.1
MTEQPYLAKEVVGDCTDPYRVGFGRNGTSRYKDGMDWKEVSEDRSAHRGTLAFDNHAESKQNQTAPSLIVKIRESFGTHACVPGNAPVPHTPLRGKRREPYWDTLIMGTQTH